MKKLVFSLALAGTVILIGLVVFFVYTYNVNQRANEKAAALEVALKAEEAALQKQKESTEYAEFLIDIVKGLAELDSSREKVIDSSTNRSMSVKEIGKLLEVSAHRGYLGVNKYSTSEYNLIRELSTQLSDVFKQLESYGAKMSINPSGNYDDLNVILNDLPAGLNVVNDYLFEKKITLSQGDRFLVLQKIEVYFKEELDSYEKFISTRLDKDFGDFYTEDLTAIFMYDILEYGHVRFNDK